MADDEDRYPTSLAENLITLLAYDDRHGKMVSQMLNTNMMEGEYRILAERLIDYRRKYNEAPKDHTADVVEDYISDPKNAKRSRGMKRTLDNMRELAPTVNREYVIDQITTFMRMQRMKGAIIESAEKLQNLQQAALPEVEKIWHDLIQSNRQNFSTGLRLTEVERTLDRVNNVSHEFTTGIKQLDDAYVVPARGQVFMFLAAAGRGKTWFAMQCTRRALENRKKVLHISLEMDEELVGMRYYQTMFNVPKRSGLIYTTTLEVQQGELRRLNRETIDVKFNLAAANVDMELNVHLQKMGRRKDNLIIKRFPGKMLTGNMLRSYLDMLEMTEGFVPDLMVLDYPRLMKMDGKSDLRISMDDTIIDLRALAVERNMAIVAPHQASKEGEQATKITNTHLSEAWGLAGTVDVLVTYSCSEVEFNYGLGRVFVAKSRYERDRFTTLITQNYNVGKFSIQSFPMRGDYAQMLKDFSGEFRNEAFTPTHVAEDVEGD